MVTEAPDIEIDDTDDETTAEYPGLADSIGRAQDRLLKLTMRRRLELLYIAGKYFNGELSQSAEARNIKYNSMFNAFISFIPQFMRSPRPIFTPKDSNGTREFATLLTAAVRKRLSECRIDNQIKNTRKNALVGIGATVCGIASKNNSKFSEPNGYLEDPGKFFVENIPVEDFIWDVCAADWDKCRFFGHFQRVNKEWAMTCGLYDKSKIELIEPIDKTNRSRPMADYVDSNRITEKYLEEIEILHLWLPREGRIIALPGGMYSTNSDTTTNLLRDDKWEGPESGPYDIEVFFTANDTTIPISMLGQMYDLSVSQNDVISKIIDRSLREKDHPVGSFRDKEYLMAIRDAKDLEPLMADDAANLKSIHVGGPTATSFTTHNMTMDLTNRAGQNPDIMGGIGEQADTLGQSQMLHGSSNVKFSDLKKTDIDFIKSICWKCAFYLWKDVVAEFDVTTYSDGDITIVERWDSTYREGELENYKIDLELYNEENDNPDAQYQNISALIQEFVLPFSQVAMEQGKAPNVDRLTEIVAGAKGFKNSDIWTSAPVLTQNPAPDVNIQGDTITNNQGKGQRLDQFKAPEIMPERITK